MSASQIQELNDLLAANRERLRSLVRLRLDARLNGRVDESDVIQEAFTEAAERFDQFRDNPTCSPFVWLRFLTLQKLAQIHRHHVQVQARSVHREARKFRAPPATSAVMAIEFMGSATSPVDAALREEQKQQLTSALDRLKETDREILAMRHFEQLSNQETAEALEITTETAYKRYVRALKRLKAELGEVANSVFADFGKSK